jgi:hypothetical protein
MAARSCSRKPKHTQLARYHHYESASAAIRSASYWQRRLLCFVGYRGRFERQGLSGGTKRRLADGLGLEEIPGVGCLDVERDAFRLRTLPEHFGEREEKRDHRDQQRDLLVPFSTIAAMCVLFVFNAVFDFMLDRVQAARAWPM